MRIKGNQKNHKLSGKLGCKITHDCAMRKRRCSAIFVGNQRRQTPLHRRKDVQILEPQLCKDIKTVKNMRMLVLMRLAVKEVLAHRIELRMF